jgi:putative heme iron utilization protein
VEVGGHPFGSVTPYCLDRQGRPVILISEIAQHTKNIGADPRVCLTVLAGGADVQASGRLSVLARAERVGEESDDVAERYYRRFPASGGYHEAHDFFFAQLEPVRLRWIGGFGDIRWIEPGDLLLANPFTRAQETAIVGHMNEDHQDAMRGYCRKLAGLAVADDAEVTMAGIDAEGCDLLAAGQHVRLIFPEPVATPADARQRLVAMARSAEPAAP